MLIQKKAYSYPCLPASSWTGRKTGQKDWLEKKDGPIGKKLVHLSTVFYFFDRSMNKKIGQFNH